MRIINILENTEGAPGCVTGHGLCFYIETPRHKLLADTGPSEDILKNAAVLGIALSDVDIVFLSHGHYDHSGGIMPFARINSRAEIYMHRRAVDAYYAYNGKEKGYHYIGIDQAIAGLSQVVYTEGQMRIDEELSVFDGAAGRRNWPETNKRLRKREGEEYVQDEFVHEQYLVIESMEKKILLSGCAHNGILNILDRYQEIYGSGPDLMISGFHLMKKSAYTEREKWNIQETARELKRYTGTTFYTCHCTGLQAYGWMKDIMGDQLRYVHCGEEIQYW